MTVRDGRTKVVVRHLPPSLSEEAFLSALGDWIHRTNWFDYRPGKVTSVDGRIAHKKYLVGGAMRTKCSPLCVYFPVTQDEEEGRFKGISQF